MTIKAETNWLWIHRILMPVLLLILTGVVSIGGYIGSKIWDRVEHGLINLDSRVGRIELDVARTDANRFTSQHWNDAKTRIDEDRAILDRRVTRLEESSAQIKESLSRIETKIDKLQDRQP